MIILISDLTNRFTILLLYCEPVSCAQIFPFFPLVGIFNWGRCRHLMVCVVAGTGGTIQGGCWSGVHSKQNCNGSPFLVIDSSLVQQGHPLEPLLCPPMPWNCNIRRRWMEGGGSDCEIFASMTPLMGQGSPQVQHRCTLVTIPCTSLL